MKKRSLWERLTGSIDIHDEEESSKDVMGTGKKTVDLSGASGGKKNNNGWIEEENSEAELAVDVYQTPTGIIVQTMVAGVNPEDLELSIARDIMTIRGKRAENKTIDEENYFIKELYWGRFTRTISLPEEVEPEEVDATERHGLLTVKLQKVDKEKTNMVKVKSI